MSIDSYEVRRFAPFGVAIIGPVPLSEISRLLKGWAKDGYKICDAVVAERLGASMAVTRDQASSEAWRKSLGLGPDNPDWLLSGDTGMSSKTIYSVMRGGRSPQGSIPYDGDDFGRCYRLVKRFPAYRDRLSEVSDVYPEWKPIVEHWDHLCAVFEGEGELDESGREKRYAAKTTGELRKLRGEVR